MLPEKSVPLIKVTIGIPAYNEEANIGNLLSALLRQKTEKVCINEIIVVSSGSTDRTECIVDEFSKIDRRVKLIKQPYRMGKASAVNEILKVARNEVIVLESADTIPKEDAIEKLCLPFADKSIGMTGGHPIPVNSEDTFIGYTIHLLWKIHHHIALKRPKCGELVAFRKLISKIPTDAIADEAMIEYQIWKRGYRVIYVSEAAVYNKGPEMLQEFLEQRRRIAYGHITLVRGTKYRVSTHDVRMILSAVLQNFPLYTPKQWFWFFSALILNVLGMLLGYYDYFTKRSDYLIWKVIKTTKRLPI